MHQFTLLLMLAVGLAFGQDFNLSPCYGPAARCNCPTGTTFASSFTTQVMGARASDFKAIAGHFFNASWIGLTVTSTTGNETVPGATRNILVPTSTGTYNVTEKLTLYSAPADGGFTYYHELATGKYLPQNAVHCPIPYLNGSGEFAHYWESLEASFAGPMEVFIKWTVNSCFTGNPVDFKALKEGGLANAVSMLKSQGRLGGITLPVATINS